MKVRLLTAAVSVAALGLFASACAPEPPPPTTPAASTVDQSHVVPAPAPWGNSSFAIAQTFTAGRTGSLDKISLQIYNTAGPVEVSIQAVTTTGSPSGTPIVAATVLAGPVQQSALTDIPLTTPAPVAAGVKYALVVDFGGPPDGTGATYGASPGSYPDGEVYYRSYAGQWTLLGGTPDLAFTTWVR